LCELENIKFLAEISNQEYNILIEIALV